MRRAYIKPVRKRRISSGKDDNVVKSLKSLKYDERSGNLFRESIVRAVSLPDWYNATVQRPSTNGVCNVSNDEYFPSLFSISKAFIVNHVDDMDLETLEGLNWRYGKMIWEDVCDADRDSFHLFTLFATAYRLEPDFVPIKLDDLADTPIPPNSLRTRNQFIRLHEGHLYKGPILSQLTSQANIWLVFLSFGQQTAQFSRSDFLALADLPNLAALDLSRAEDDPSIDSFDNVVLRQWARKVNDKERNESCFARLKYIDLRGRDHEFYRRNRDLVAHLAVLPALRFVNLSRRQELEEIVHTRISSASCWNLHCDKMTAVHQNHQLASRLQKHYAPEIYQNEAPCITPGAINDESPLINRLRAILFKSTSSGLHDLVLAYESLVIQYLREDVGVLAADVHLINLDPAKVDASQRRREKAADSWQCVFLERVKDVSPPGQELNAVDETKKKRPLSKQTGQSGRPLPRKLKHGKAVDLGSMLGSFSQAPPWS